MMIGLTGSFCSGKDTAAEYLVQQKGFAHCSLSDELRKELVARGIPETRENLIVTGTALRENEGNTVLAKRVLHRCAAGGNYVITSIRHCAEVEELRQRKDFILVNLDAPASIRFERMRRRARRGDPSTFEQFLALEEKESQSTGAGQQLRACAQRADVTIMNDTGSLEELHQKIDELLTRYGAGH